MEYFKKGHGKSLQVPSAFGAQVGSDLLARQAGELGQLGSRIRHHLPSLTVGA